MEIALLGHINAASLAVEVMGLSHRPLFLNQKRQIVNLDAIALQGDPRRREQRTKGQDNQRIVTAR
jgi:hypothetical protein